MIGSEKKTGRLRQRLDAGHMSPLQATLMALNHPLRVKLLSAYCEEESSPSALSLEGLDSLSNCAYHTRVLWELRQIEIVNAIPKRGALEHVYRASKRPLFQNDEWEMCDPVVRRAISAYGLDWIFRDINDSLADGTFDRRPDRHLSRTPMVLDKQGWVEANAVQNDGLQQLLAIQAKATERMAGSDETGIRALAAMACFERTPEPDRPQ